MTSSDQIVESGVTLVNSETVVPSSDPIEIGAVTRSHSKHKSEVDDGDTSPVTLSDETNRMLRDMDRTKRNARISQFFASFVDGSKAE